MPEPRSRPGKRSSGESQISRDGSISTGNEIEVRNSRPRGPQQRRPASWQRLGKHGRSPEGKTLVAVLFHKKLTSGQCVHSEPADAGTEVRKARRSSPIIRWVEKPLSSLDCSQKSSLPSVAVILQPINALQATHVCLMHAGKLVAACSL